MSSDEEMVKPLSKNKKKLKIWLALIIVGVVALVVIGLFVWFGRSNTLPDSPKAKDKQPDAATVQAQVNEKAKAVVNGDDSNMEQVVDEIFSVGMPMYDYADMLYVLAKYYLKYNDKLAAQYYSARIEYVEDVQISGDKIKSLNEAIEALPDPVIEEGVDI